MAAGFPLATEVGLTAVQVSADVGRVYDGVSLPSGIFCKL